jgi:type II secretory pathway pseudopilin PulG
MKKYSGFTLIELILFIVITGILATTILSVLIMALSKTPADRQQIIALQTAQQCMEWYLGQRRMKGFSTITCSASPTTPTACTLPTGYSFSNSITCTTINTDTNYKLIKITVSGPGDATLQSIIADH